MKKNSASQWFNTYLTAKKKGKDPYFDVDQIEDMLDYLEETNNLRYYDEVLALGLKLHPFHEDLQIRRCRKLLYDGYTQEALQQTNELQLPGNPEVEILRVQCYATLNDFKSVRKVIMELEKTDHHALEIVLEELVILLDDRDLFQQSKPYLTWGLELFPDNLVLQEELCYVYESEGKYTEAIQIANKLIDRHPFANEYWFMLGRLYLINHEYEKAVEACDFAQTCDPEAAQDADLQMLKIYGLYLNESYEKVLEVYEECNKSSTNLDRLLPMIAECYLRMGNRDKCIELMQDYNNEGHDPSENFLSVFRVCLELGQKEGAVRSLMQAYEQFPQDLRVLCLLTTYYIEENELEKAMHFFDEIVEVIRTCPLTKEDASVLHQAGQALCLVGKAKEAIILFDKAFEVDPDIPNQEIYYSFAYAKIGDMKQFSSYLNEAVDEEEEANDVLDDLDDSYDLQDLEEDEALDGRETPSGQKQMLSMKDLLVPMTKESSQQLIKDLIQQFLANKDNKN